MSLDVYLVTDDLHIQSGSGIWVRKDGATKQITREEWDRENPDREPVMLNEPAPLTDRVFHGNITHNLSAMAEKADLYEALWRPGELGITKAGQLIERLSLGLAQLELNPGFYSTFNPENGWGTYEQLVEFVRDYLAACVKYPEAEVRVWR